MLLSQFGLFFTTVFSCLYTATALSLTGERTLIIYDSNYLNQFYHNENGLDHEHEEAYFEENFAKFLQILETNYFNYTLHDINNNNDSDFQLIKVDTPLYDNVIVFPILKSSLKKGTTPSKSKLFLSSTNLLTFFDNYNGNLMIVTSPNIQNPDTIINTLNQFGIYPAPKNQLVYDYFQDKDTLVVSSSNLINKYVYKLDNGEDDTKYPFFKLGNSSVAKLDNRRQLVPILKASKTSFINPVTSLEKNFESWVTGSQGYLIAGFQGVNNCARLTWLGSTDMLTDLNHEENQYLIENIINWNFNAKSVIKSIGSRHYHAETELNYDDLNYKVNDMINYEIEITEWDGSNWVPFIASDIQFELRQVDPYYRINLTRILSDDNETFATYTTDEFKLPNRHGMFKFITEYERNGLSSIRDEDIRAIRHLANDEYPRSWDITNAWVYLSANVVVITVFIVFIILFLTNTNVPPFKKSN